MVGVALTRVGPEESVPNLTCLALKSHAPRHDHRNAVGQHSIFPAGVRFGLFGWAHAYENHVCVHCVKLGLSAKVWNRAEHRFVKLNCMSCLMKCTKCGTHFEQQTIVRVHLELWPDFQQVALTFGREKIAPVRMRWEYNATPFHFSLGMLLNWRKTEPRFHLHFAHP